jgi:Zn finger protein HypA/HybF involved in hydrogenase expression
MDHDVLQIEEPSVGGEDMKKVPITLMGYRCERCKHEWIPKNAKVKPRVCPKCKSPYWHLPRRRKSTK